MQVTNIDLGGSKLRLEQRETLRSPSAQYYKVKHGLGGPLADPNVSIEAVLGSAEFSKFAACLRGQSFEWHRVTSNFFVCTAPGRAAQRKDPGKFPAKVLEETGFFPLVISAHLEAKLMALALRSRSSECWAELCQHPSLLHIHPGSQSLEISLSSRGHASYGPEDVLGFEESLGFLATPFQGNKESDFQAYQTQIKERLLGSPHIIKVIERVNGLEEEAPQLVVSGRAFRKLLNFLPRRVPDEKRVIHHQDVSALTTKLLRNIEIGGEDTSENYKNFGLASSQIYAVAVLGAILEILPEGCSKKGVYVTDASLLHGINELRIHGSFDHVLMPELAEDMYDELMKTLIGDGFNKRQVRDKAKELQAVLLLLVAEEERAGFYHNAVLHGLSHAVFDTVSKEPSDELFARCYGANRFPGHPREYQEDFYNASLPRDYSLRCRDEPSKSSAIVDLCRAVFTGLEPKRVHFGLSSGELRIQACTTGELRELQSREDAIKDSAKRFGIDPSKVAFELI